MAEESNLERQTEPREQADPERGQSLLDRRLDLGRVELQVWIFVALLLVAALLRFWDLGVRAMHHDEAIHAWFSWRFYTGQDLYRYDPAFHGPFLYHLTALFYFLFGVSDAVARAPQALFGVLLVALCYPLRRWLGRRGWLIAAALLTFSPAFVYFSRFARHDAFAVVWALGLAIALFRYLEGRRPRDLALAAAALALSFATKELTFITAFIFLSFLGLAYLLDRLAGRFQAEGRIVAGVLFLVSFIWEIGLAGRPGSPPVLRALLMALALLSLGYLGLSFLWPRLFPQGSSPVRTAVHALGENPRPLLAAMGVFGLLFGLLFTTMLTYPRGFLDGLVRGLEYWTQQQEVRRGGQPWFYYLLLLPLYEPVVLTAGAAGFGLVLARMRRAKERAAGTAGPGEREAGGAAAIFPAFLAYWALFSLVLYSWAGEKMPWLLLHVALPLLLLAALALDRFAGWIVERSLWRSWDWSIGPLLLLLLFAMRGLLSLRTGQVPHELAAQYLNLQQIVLLLIVLGLIALLAWRVYRTQARHLGQSLAATGLLLLALYTVRSTFMLNYFNGDTPRELLVYTQTAPDVPLVVRQIERLSLDQTRDDRTRRDPAGGHGLQIAVDTTNALNNPFDWYLRDFDQAGTLTLFSAAGGPPPDADVLLVLADNQPQVEPYLVNSHTGMRLHHRWWFPEFETYQRWTLVGQGQTEIGYSTMPWLRTSTYSQAGVNALWEYLLYRRLPYELGSQDLTLYIRNELLPAGLSTVESDPYLQVLAPRTASGVLGIYGSGPGQLNGPRGISLSAAGDLYIADSGNNRIVRFDAAQTPFSWGSLCVLEAADQAGCLDPDGDGPLPLGAGQFNEPWGVAVDAEGRVYVADTWNHRIQVFDGEGAFLGQWGEGRLVDADSDPRGRSGTPMGFYGPRGLAVDAEGRVYVSDTGNERVLVYAIHETEGGQVEAEFLEQWGGMGPAPGEFLEPVGLAVDASGRVYVADTLNGRMQVFAPALTGDRLIDEEPVVTWDIRSWASASRENKPYLAVDPGGLVYFAVPERNYVAVTDWMGNILTVWGGYGTGLDALALPIAVAVDAEGRVYVSDSGNSRILIFPAP